MPCSQKSIPDHSLPRSLVAPAYRRLYRRTYKRAASRLYPSRVARGGISFLRRERNLGCGRIGQGGLNRGKRTRILRRTGDNRRRFRGNAGCIGKECIAAKKDYRGEQQIVLSGCRPGEDPGVLQRPSRLLYRRTGVSGPLVTFSSGTSGHTGIGTLALGRRPGISRVDLL